MRNGESTIFRADSIDRGHGGHTTVLVRKYVVEEEEKEEEEEMEELMCARHGEKFTW